MEQDAARARAELLRSLGRLVRGLSLLFWGLPLACLAQLELAKFDWLGAAGAWSCAPAVALNSALVYALGQLRRFQPQERIWQNALTRGEILAMINAGFSPFIYFWHRFPNVRYFAFSVGLLALTNLLFLIQVNRILQRLAAMLPDETVRAESKLFASFSIWLLAFVVAALAAWFGADTLCAESAGVRQALAVARLGGSGVILFLTLFPLALTMALLWKIKEVVFAGLFSHVN